MQALSDYKTFTIILSKTDKIVIKKREITANSYIKKEGRLHITVFSFTTVIPYDQDYSPGITVFL